MLMSEMLTGETLREAEEIQVKSYRSDTKVAGTFLRYERWAIGTVGNI